ncbi:hypothetical protein BKA80DRAFT_270945 [Phyllosticta citrichinensis]
MIKLPRPTSQTLAMRFKSRSSKTPLQSSMAALPMPRSPCAFSPWRFRPLASRNRTPMPTMLLPPSGPLSSTCAMKLRLSCPVTPPPSFTTENCSAPWLRS